MLCIQNIYVIPLEVQSQVRLQVPGPHAALHSVQVSKPVTTGYLIDLIKNYNQYSNTRNGIFYDLTLAIKINDSLYNLCLERLVL